MSPFFNYLSTDLNSSSLFVSVLYIRKIEFLLKLIQIQNAADVIFSTDNVTLYCQSKTKLKQKKMEKTEYQRT